MRRWCPAAADSRQIKYEATVGAGLPIIDTYHKLVETGDRVLRIDGSVSGTLMYVVSAVSAGKPFSEAVREAVERGYAEPDPRDDLSGRDAARKALILARLLGYRGAAPVPDDLVPRALRKLPLDEFMTRLPKSMPSGRRASRAKRHGPRAALRRHRDATRRVGAAPAVPVSSPDRRSAGHAQSRRVHDAPLSHRAARHQRARRRRRGDGGGHPERHLLAQGLATELARS